LLVRLFTMAYCRPRLNFFLDALASINHLSDGIWGLTSSAYNPIQTSRIVKTIGRGWILSCTSICHAVEKVTITCRSIYATCFVTHIVLDAARNEFRLVDFLEKEVDIDTYGSTSLIVRRSTKNRNHWDHTNERRYHQQQ
jgi:hypothetical protein